MGVPGDRNGVVPPSDLPGGGGGQARVDFGHQGKENCGGVMSLGISWVPLPVPVIPQRGPDRYENDGIHVWAPLVGVQHGDPSLPSYPPTIQTRKDIRMEQNV